MSHLQLLTRELVRDADARRGTFTPTGVPYDIYRWWRQRTTRDIVRENFCHYWRVVLIWAPLMAVRKGITHAFGYLSVKIGAVVAGVLAVLGFLYMAPIYWDVVWVVLIALYGVASLVVVLLIFASSLEELRELYQHGSAGERLTLWVISVVLLPAILLATLIKATYCGPVMYLQEWLERTRVLGGSLSLGQALALLIASVLALGGIGVSIATGWWPLVLAVVAGLAVFVLLGMAIARTARSVVRWMDRRAEEEKREENRSYLAMFEPLLWEIFVDQHPERAALGDKENNPFYQTWRRRYVAYQERKNQLIWHDVYTIGLSRLNTWSWSSQLTSRAYDVLNVLRQEAPVRPPSAFRRRIAAVLRVVRDFAVLVGQIIRVNKWKICPIVELP